MVTIVNDKPSLTKIKEDPSLTMVNNFFSFKYDRFLKAIVFKKRLYKKQSKTVLLTLKLSIKQKNLKKLEIENSHKIME